MCYLRIKDVFEDARTSGKKLGVDDMEALQSDVVSLLARELQRLLRQAIAAAPEAMAEPERSAGKLLLDWDGSLDQTSGASYRESRFVGLLATLVVRPIRGDACAASSPHIAAFIAEAIVTARKRLDSLQNVPDRWSTCGQHASRRAWALP